MVHVNFYQEQFRITFINNAEAQHNHKCYRSLVDKHRIQGKKPNEQLEIPRDFSINFPFSSLGGSID